MEKIVPIKSGVYRIKNGKEAVNYDMQAGVEISVPSELVEVLKKKGFLEQSLEKEIINNKKEKVK